MIKKYEIIRTTNGYYKGGINSIAYLLKGDRIRSITQTELEEYNKKYPKIHATLPLFIYEGDEITRVSIFSVVMKVNNEPKYTKQLN